ncbi:unnamed protein product, partial [Ectocarpus sp. 12 AP-2014]
LCALHHHHHLAQSLHTRRKSQEQRTSSREIIPTGGRATHIATCTPFHSYLQIATSERKKRKVVRAAQRAGIEREREQARDREEEASVAQQDCFVRGWHGKASYHEDAHSKKHRGPGERRLRDGREREALRPWRCCWQGRVGRGGQEGTGRCADTARAARHNQQGRGSRGRG